jgi:ubiquinone/menaquinone biosynthesis C-methylase UbiE
MLCSEAATCRGERSGGTHVGDYTGRYDAIADWYDEQMRHGGMLHGLQHDLILPALLDLAGDVRGMRMLDLACGHGDCSRALARLGASVIGVDVSEGMLALARREEAAAPLGITYRHDDAHTGATLDDASFDGVVCNMALMDIPDLDAAFRTVYRALRPGGRFAFAVTHPCVQMPFSDWAERPQGQRVRVSGDYFAEGYWLPAGAPGVRGRVGAYHRTLATLVNGLLAAGFQLEQLAEPRASGDYAGEAPWYARIPAALLVRCRKG